MLLDQSSATHAPPALRVAVRLRKRFRMASHTIGEQQVSALATTATDDIESHYVDNTVCDLRGEPGPCDPLAGGAERCESLEDSAE